MNFQDLQNEVYDRGGAYLNDSGRGVQRVARWVNQAYREVNDQDDWPYLMGTTTGPAPLTIADLGTIESVINVATQTKLVPADRRSITDRYPVLTTTGVGYFYYITGGTVLNVYPADVSSVLTVSYWRSAPDMALASDVPLIPSQYQEIIVTGALRRLFLEDNDAGDYQSVVAEWNLQLAWMREALTNLQADQPDFVAQTAPHDGW